MDDRLRRLERAAAGGDPDAVRALDTARLRAGTYVLRDLELAAWLGRSDLITRFGLDPALEVGARYMAFTRPARRARLERIYDTEVTPPGTGAGGALTIQGGQAGSSGVGGIILIGGTSSSGAPLGTMNDWFHGLLRFGTDPYYRAMLSLGELGYQALCEEPFEAFWITPTGARSLPDDRVLCRQLLDVVKKWLESGQTLELARECGQIVTSWPTDFPYQHSGRASRRAWWVELGRSVFTGITSTAYSVVSVLLGYEIVRTPAALRRICADLMPTKAIPPQAVTDYDAPP